MHINTINYAEKTKHSFEFGAKYIKKNKADRHTTRRNFFKITMRTQHGLKLLAATKEEERYARKPTD